MIILDNVPKTTNCKKYSTIIIITLYPLSERDYHRFGIDLFLKNEYTVKILTLFPLFTKDYAKIGVHNLMEYEGHKQIFTYNELSSELGNYSPDSSLIIMHCPIMCNNLKIYRVFKNYAFDYAITNLGNLPSPTHHDSPKCYISSYTITQYIQSFSVKAVLDKLLALFPKKYYWLLGITPAKYYLVGGVSALKIDSEYYITDRTTIISAHSMDYDLYLDMVTSKSSQMNFKYKYCVFIDQYFPYHPDFAIDTGKSPCSEEKYYPALNQFFDYIEKKFNVIVIIAAHPRADYHLHPHAYPNRRVISGKTNLMVRDADFVIMHNSTAINYAVLFKKSIIFLTTDEMKYNNMGFYYDEIYTFAEYFGQTPINIDGDYSSLCEIPNIDDNIYEKYINDFIKIKNSPEKKIWEIFIDEIEKN